MKLIFLGSGSAFTVGENNFHSNMLLEDDQKNRLLIDCGSDARFSLHEQGLSYNDIKDVYISHLHSDHAGGLEWLAFTTKFNGNNSAKPKLHVSTQLLDKLWKNELSGSLQSIPEFVAELTTYFLVDPIDKENSFQWSSIQFNLVPTEHTYSGGVWMPSYGLFFTVDGINCFITTDTQFFPDKYMDYYQKADIIFHDCETSLRHSGVHSHYSQLVTLDPSIKAKMWLYHYNPGGLPDAKKDGFCGFVKKGQVFDFSDKKNLCNER